MLLADTLIVIGLTTVSLGSIHESDGPKEHTFCLRNVGSCAVTLAQGYTSCGCTTIVFPKDSLIQPNDSAHITLRFNPRGKGGDFEETGTIVYSLKSQKQKDYSLPSRKAIRLSLIGTCITSEETLLRQYPVRISDSLRISANRFDLGILHVGETCERNVAILHRDENNRCESIPIIFTVAPTTPKGLQHIPYHLKVGTHDVIITLDAVIR